MTKKLMPWRQGKNDERNTALKIIKIILFFFFEKKGGEFTFENNEIFTTIEMYQNEKSIPFSIFRKPRIIH